MSTQDDHWHGKRVYSRVHAILSNPPRKRSRLARIWHNIKRRLP